MAQSIELWGATYNNVPAVDLPKSTSGTARFTDTSITTATESDVRSGAVFIKSDGSQGTGSIADMTLPTSASSSYTGTRKAIISPSTSVRYLNIPTGYNGANAYYHLSAMEVAPLSVTQNGTYNANDLQYDLDGFSVVTVNVSGGGGSSVNTAVAEGASSTGTISFENLRGEPTSFFILYDESTISLPTGTPYKTVAVVYDGTNLYGQVATNISNAQASSDTNFQMTYSNGTLTVTSSDSNFAGIYVLRYTYGGSSANVHTQDVQVGSGATSISFTGLDDQPIMWSCIFKSDFGTNQQNYQRVMAVGGIVADGYGGACLDSSVHISGSYWDSSTYSNGTLTITSQGTNAGGYFHQPGYYQLTYVLGEASPYQNVSKTYRASTSAQSDIIEPDTGYDAMSRVSVSIPAVTQTNLTAANIKSGTTVSISNGSTNLWSVTGTYTGGGGSSTVASKTATLSSAANTISFTGLSGTPIAWFARCTTQLTSSSTTYYYVVDVRYNGTNTQASLFRMGSTRRVQSQTTGFSYTYSNGTLTITSTATSASVTPGYFYNGSYELTYIY